MLFISYFYYYYNYYYYYYYYYTVYEKVGQQLCHVTPVYKISDMFDQNPPCILLTKLGKNQFQ